MSTTANSSPPSFRDRLVDLLEELRAVRQSRERVVHRLVKESALAAFQLAGGSNSVGHVAQRREGRGSTVPFDRSGAHLENGFLVFLEQIELDRASRLEREIEASTDQLVSVVAEQPFRRRVPQDDYAGSIGDEDAVGVVRNERGELSPTSLDRVPQPVAFEGVANGASEQLGPELRLAEAVLGPVRDCSSCELPIGPAAHDHDRHVGCHLGQASVGIEPVRVGEPEGAQDEVGRDFGNPFSSVGQSICPDERDFELRPLEVLAYERVVGRVVLYDQDAGVCAVAHRDL